MSTPGVKRIARTALLAIALALVGGCATGGAGAGAGGAPADVAAQRLLCPELGGNVDPLEVSYSDKPSADAQLRALVSAVRGVSDATLEIERRAVESCQRIRRDVGAPEVPTNSTLDVQCAPIHAIVAKAREDGISVAISVAPPRCSADTARAGKCAASTAAAAAANRPETGSLCEAEAIVYSRCSLPAVTFGASRSTEDLAKLGKSLEENLPSLLYAEYALARRLSAHVETIAQTAPKLATEIGEAGPHGLACMGLSVATSARSAERLKSFLSATQKLLADLSPEITP